MATALERSRAWKASRRRFVAAVKETCGCVDCGTHAGRLDFDHRPRTIKEFSLAHPWASWSRLLAEIDKCDVRCVRCHAIRHAAPRRGKPSGRPIQSHCKRGHSLLEPANVYVHSGRRICLECKRQRVSGGTATLASSPVASGGTATLATAPVATGSTASLDTTPTASGGAAGVGGTAPVDTPAYLVVGFIIKT